MKNILFVCTGNTCRSPMAAAILRHMAKKEKLELEVHSRGLMAAPNQPLSEGARLALEKVGIVSATPHASKRVDHEDVTKADLILVMEEIHKQNLVIKWPETESKTFLLKEYTGLDEPYDVEDPIGRSPAHYEMCRMELQDALLGLLPKLKNS